MTDGGETEDARTEDARTEDARAEDARTEDAGTDGPPSRGLRLYAVSDHTREPGAYRVAAAVWVGLESNSRCVSRRLGPCAQTVCDPLSPTPDGAAADAAVDAAVDAGTPPPPPTAGRIVVEGVEMVVLDPEDGVYADVRGDFPLWTPPEPLTVRALGADAPAFTLTLATPSAVQVMQPNMTEPPAILSKSNPVLDWQGSTEGRVRFGISWTGPREERVIVGCGFDPSARPVSLPVELLAPIPTGESGQIWAASDTYERMDVDGWQIAMTARTWAIRTSSAGVPGVGSVPVSFTE